MPSTDLVNLVARVGRAESSVTMVWVNESDEGVTVELV